MPEKKSLRDVLNITMFNKILLFNPRATVMLDNLPDLSMIFYQYRQCNALINEKNLKQFELPSEEQLAAENERLFEINCEGLYIDSLFKSGKFEAADELLKKQRESGYESYSKSAHELKRFRDLQRHMTRNKILLYAQLLYDFENGYFIGEDGEIPLDNSLFDKISLRVKRKILKSHGDNELTKELKFSREKFEKYIDVAKELIDRYGGVITGDFALAMYNYENNSETGFIPDRIDIIMTDLNMFNYCYMLYGSRKKSTKQGELYFVYKGEFNVKITLPSELEPIRFNLTRIRSLEDNGKYESVPENLLNLFHNLRSVDLAMDSNKCSFSKEQILFIFNNLNTCKTLSNSFFYLLERHMLLGGDLVFPQKFAEDLGYRNFKPMENFNLEEFAEKFSGRNFGELIGFFYPGSPPKTGYYLNIGFLEIKEIYFSSLVDEYIVKAKEFYDNKPKKEPNLIDIIQNHVSRFDLEFCKLIWTPTDGFNLTKSFQTFCAAKFESCVYSRKKINTKRAELYRSRGYSVIISLSTREQKEIG